MRDILRDKDFLAGTLFILIGGFFAVGALDYGMGTARRMGPGYFPIVLGSILVAIGVALAAKSLWQRRSQLVPSLHLRPVAALTASILSFAALLDRAGLVAACIVSVIVASLASRESRLWETALVAVFMAGLSALVFVYLLRMPMSIWGR